MSACPQPSICGPESKAGCWVCLPDDEPLVGHTRWPAQSFPTQNDTQMEQE